MILPRDTLVDEGVEIILCWTIATVVSTRSGRLSLCLQVQYLNETIG